MSCWIPFQFNICPNKELFVLPNIRDIEDCRIKCNIIGCASICYNPLSRLCHLNGDVVSKKNIMDMKDFQYTEPVKSKLFILFKLCL